MVSVGFTLPVRLGVGILIATCLSTATHAQNVGIAIPQSKLTVNGSAASGGIAVGDTTYNVASQLWSKP
jgi:hypothetical protein